MLQRLARMFDKERDIPLNREEVVMKREPNERFGYRIVDDWEDENKTYHTAVDSDDFPIVFPGSDTTICGETEEIVRSRMWSSYPMAEEIRGQKDV